MNLTALIYLLSVSENYPIFQELTACSETYKSQLAQSCKEVCIKQLCKYLVSKSAFEALISNWPNSEKYNPRIMKCSLERIVLPLMYNQMLAESFVYNCESLSNITATNYYYAHT